jgi:UDP-N-acetylglucosamine--N-acetylmuramyl-(pentapeptide) pyrophosphoryl-undecaprenol N-acetylglucosamine transferase
VHDPRPVVLFAGGGTGGHLYPALALADALSEIRADVRAVFVGARSGVEARVLPEREVEHVLLPVRGLRRGRGLGEIVGVAPALARSFATAWALCGRLRPALVVVTGGYAGAPAGLVAAARRVPLVLQEQNSVPGQVTRRLAPFARRIHLAFPEAVGGLPARARDRCVVSGNPIRFLDPELPAEARRRLGLDPELPVLLVVGGSQGSAALNRAVVDMLLTARGRGLSLGMQVLWSTGPAHEADVHEALGAVPADVHVLPYLTEMPTALAATTLALSRAGAMATSEFLACGTPAILVPLPTAAADHQTHNARALGEAGAAIHLPEADLTGAALLDAVRALLDDPTRRAALSSVARSRGRPGAARDIAADLAGFLPAGGGAA